MLHYLLYLTPLLLYLFRPPPTAPPPPPPPLSPTKLDHFIFVQQWPAAFCYFNRHNCNPSKLVDDYTIHGIWPANYKGVSLRQCSEPKPFDVSYHPNEEFWKHEWNEHRICSTRSNPRLYGKDYFRGALQMKRKTDIYQILKDKGTYIYVHTLYIHTRVHRFIFPFIYVLFYY